MSDLQRYGILEESQNFEKAVYSLALIYNICHNEMTSYLKPYHLTPGKLNILVAIRFHGGSDGVSQVEISKHLIVTPSNMTKLIDKLQAEGFVTRSALPGDRRVNVIRVTKKAEVLLDRVWAPYCTKLKNFMGKLSEKEQEATAKHLVKWLSCLTHD